MRKVSLSFSHDELYCLWRALDLAIDAGPPCTEGWDEEGRPIRNAFNSDDIPIWETIEKLRDRIDKKL